MQRLSGTGMAFVEIDGELVEYTLEPGQKLIVDTGNVAGFDTTVDIDHSAGSRPQEQAVRR